MADQQEDIAQTIERKRREYTAEQDKQGYGTLGGFLNMLRKRKQATESSGSTDLEAVSGGQGGK